MTAKAHNLEHFTANKSHRIEPSVSKVYLGETALLYCNSLGPVRWTHNKQNLKSPFVEQFDRSLFVNNVSLIDGGKYECYGTDERGQKFIAEGEVRIYGECF